MLYDRREMTLSVDGSCRRVTALARVCAALLLMALVAGCASHRGGGGGASASVGRYKVGAPYTIDGVTYVPKEEFNHTEIGIASWYGPGFHGKYTANGEVYDRSDRTAAHRTLQMPSMVRVTNTDNGLSTVVRINDRGPYARSRILDVSRATAEELGMLRNGTAHIRIDQLPAESVAVKEVAMNGGGPAEQEAAAARVSSGRGTPSQPTVAVAQAPPPPPISQPVPPPLPPAAPVAAPAESVTVWAQPPSNTLPPGTTFGGRSPEAISASLASHPPGGFYVQTGAFSSMTNAERQRSLITTYGTTDISQGSAAGREVFRVRVGPYTTPDAAGIVADRLKRSGYGDARVVAD
jgi:rare lipoprotein A